MTPKHLERLGGAARRERPPANRLLAHCRQEACVHGLNPFGYRGRIGIFEAHRLREEDSDLILSHADEHTIRRRLRKFGTLSLLEDDLVKVADGTTSFAEIQSIGGLDYYASRPARRARPTTAVPKAAQPAPSLRPSDPLP